MKKEQRSLKPLPRPVTFPPEKVPKKVEDMEIYELSSSRCYDGLINKYEHYSICNKCMMTFSIYMPFNEKYESLPGLFYLAGLTATEDSFVEKAGALKKASELKMFLICPDTSPRNTPIEGDEGLGAIGAGASYYLNATQDKWLENYQMLTYIKDELPSLIFYKFTVNPEKVSVFGHSVGGHAALYLSLKEQSIFKSCSAFAPVCSLINNHLGRKALETYIGDSKESWKQFDAVEVLKANGGKLNIPTLIDQGESDEFYKGEYDSLNFKLFKETLAQGETKLTLNLHEGYDHTYWFIQVFVNSHLEFHAKILKS